MSEMRASAGGPRPTGFVLAAGSAGVFVASVVAMATEMPSQTAIPMLLLVAATASLQASLLAALVLGVIAWLFATGFVVNDGGELHVRGSEGWLRLVAYLICTALVAYSSRRPRRQGVPQPSRRTERVR